jgi:hypothetical protein
VGDEEQRHLVRTTLPKNLVEETWALGGRLPVWNAGLSSVTSVAHLLIYC